MGFLEIDSDDVRDVIHGWKPLPCSTEREYEDQLYDLLNREFPRSTVYRQYTLAMTRADLFVRIRGGASVVIEVKCGLTSRTEYHRLLGQVYEYLTEWKAEVVVVLCGDTDPALGKSVREYVATIGGALERKARLVIKSSGATKYRALESEREPW